MASEQRQVRALFPTDVAIATLLGGTGNIWYECYENWRDRAGLYELPCFGAFDADGALVGVTLLSSMDFDPLNKFAKPYMLEMIFVKETARRSGYGSRLVEHLKTCYQCHAAVIPASESFFKAAGFTREMDYGAAAIYCSS